MIHYEYFQCIAVSSSIILRLELVASDPTSLPGSQQTRYLTSITIAWSYIISCLWVERLERAGETCMLLQENPGYTPGFWETITQSRWSAQIKRRKGTWFSPWMLQQHDFDEHQRFALIGLFAMRFADQSCLKG